MERMGNPALQPGERFAYRQYRTWPDDERWELIDGQAWNMSPAPLSAHQEILGRLLSRLASYLEGRPCKAFAAPFDVLLPVGEEDDDEVDTVVQPDIVVYCDRSRVTRRGGRGAPDFIVEILSARTAKKDFKEKYELYESRGVREYWIVDPDGKNIHAWILDPAGRYGEETVVGIEAPLSSAVFPGFEVDTAKLFGDLW